MWNDLKCGKMNDYATKFAFIVLCIDPDEKDSKDNSGLIINESMLQKHNLKENRHTGKIFLNLSILLS